MFYATVQNKEFLLLNEIDLLLNPSTYIQFSENMTC